MQGERERVWQRPETVKPPEGGYYERRGPRTVSRIHQQTREVREGADEAGGVGYGKSR